MWIIGDDFCETIDYKNYARQEDLIGQWEAQAKYRPAVLPVPGSL
jgi:hypothetical protein